MLTELGKVLTDKGFDHIVDMFEANPNDKPVMGFMKNDKMTHYRVERIDKVNRKIWAQPTTLFMEDEVDIVDKPKRRGKK